MQEQERRVHEAGGRTRRRRAAALTAALAVAAIVPAMALSPADASAHPSPADPTAPTSPGFPSSPSAAGSDLLLAVNGTSSTGVWAVGQSNISSSQWNTLIERWSGGAWKVVASPNPQQLNSLTGVVALTADDAWAVGQSLGAAISPLVQHWDGTSWTDVTVPLPKGSTGATLQAVAGTSSDDVWAVGTEDTTTGDLPLVEHWNGSSWKVAHVPAPPTATQNALVAVDALAPNDVWAVGNKNVEVSGSLIEETLAEHWNGSSWAVVRSPNVQGSGDTNLNGIAAASPTNIWSVGATTQGNSPETLAEHWNGKQWAIKKIAAPSGDNGVLTSIAAAPKGGFWAAGYATPAAFAPVTLTERYTNGAWKIVPSPNPGSQYGFLRGIDTVGSRAWAVGNAYTSSYAASTLAEQWEHRAWHIVGTPSP
jgi:hypothetical protein